MCTLKDHAEILLHKSYCLLVIFHRLKFRQNSPFEIKYPTSYLFCIDINPYIKRHNHSLIVEYRVLQLNATDIIGIHLMQTYILKRRESSGRPQVKMRWQIILINACRNELTIALCCLSSATPSPEPKMHIIKYCKIRMSLFKLMPNSKTRLIDSTERPHILFG